MDVSQAGDKSTRRSIKGYILFVNKVPIMWFSKKQNTVESSTFPSELIAMKTYVKFIKNIEIKIIHFWYTN